MTTVVRERFATDLDVRIDSINVCKRREKIRRSAGDVEGREGRISTSVV